MIWKTIAPTHFLPYFFNMYSVLNVLAFVTITATAALAAPADAVKTTTTCKYETTTTAKV